MIYYNQPYTKKEESRDQTWSTSFQQDCTQSVAGEPRTSHKEAGREICSQKVLEQTSEMNKIWAVEHTKLTAQIKPYKHFPTVHV